MQLTVDVLKYRSNGILTGRLSQLFAIISVALPDPFISIVIVRLLFNADISLKIFANISIGRIKYMNGINKVCTTSIVNSHTDRKAVFP